MNEAAAKKLIALNKSKLDISLQQVKINEQLLQDYDKAGKEREKELKAGSAAAKRAAALEAKNAKLAEKQSEELLDAQELLYSSMLSNLEQAVSEDLMTLDMAMTGLQSGPISERYNILIAKIDQAVEQMLDEKIRAELQIIRAKLNSGQQLTGDNVKMLEQYGGLTGNESSFMGRVSGVKAQTLGKKAEPGNYDADNNGKRSFGELGDEWADDMENVGEDFEDTAVGAFDNAVSQFSAQLTSAIFEGGATFGSILTSVATTFGQMLMQFVIEALSKKALGSIFGFFAEGTPAAPPGYAWVGEKGPELVRMTGGEEVVPNNQVNRRLSDLYAAGNVAQDFRGGSDITSVVTALNKQTKALLADRLNYKITADGQKQIARATRKRESQILRYSGTSG